MKNRFWLTIIIAYFLNCILTFSLLEIETNVFEIMAYGFIVLLVGVCLSFIKNEVLKKSLLLSFVLPYSIWSSMNMDIGTGLWKARWYEQLILFLILWLIIGTGVFGVFSLFKYFNSK